MATRAEMPGKRLVFGGDGPASTLIWGHFEYDRAGPHPLLRALPKVIHIQKGRNLDPDWLASATRLTVLESEAAQKGSGAVVDRLAEVLLIQALGAHMHNQKHRAGFLAALSDPVLARALEEIHADPARTWNLRELAQYSGVSRTVFTARFKEAVGASPIQYLTYWRMQKAKEMLHSSDLSIAEVSERLGYVTEWSFAKAFKRVFGEGPGAVRRSARPGTRYRRTS